MDESPGFEAATGWLNFAGPQAAIVAYEHHEYHVPVREGWLWAIQRERLPTPSRGTVRVR